MNIYQFPAPVLREKALKVKEPDNKTAAFITRLLSLMRANKGCVGIAAPQVGELKRIAIVDATENRKATDKHGLLIMINPEIIEKSGSTINREGCLSVPDFTGNVERPEHINLRYMDMEGNERKVETKGFEAVIIQHEIDHLDGILFIDRIRSARRDLFRRKNY
jgi:peptide deformylase